MKLSIKEKAGLNDTLRIYEGLHLTDSFIERAVVNSKGIESELKEEGERHFGICDKCRKKKEGFLPFSKTSE